MPADRPPKPKPPRIGWTVNPSPEVAALFDQLRAKWGGEAGAATKNKAFELMVRKCHAAEFGAGTKGKGGG